MARNKKQERSIPRGERGSPPQSDPAPPEATNRSHPAAPGQRETFPGEGVVHPEARAGEGKPAPPGTPLLDEKARRPGTTRSGPASVPDIGAAGGSNSSRATETSSDGGTAPLAPGVSGPPSSEDLGLNQPEVSRDTVRMATGAAADLHPLKPGATRGGVQDAMTVDVEVGTPLTEVDYLARMMFERNCGAIPIVENTDTMRPVGIVTDRDIVVRVIARGQDPFRLRAADCMSGDLLTVRVDETLENCARAMNQRNVGRAVIVDAAGRCCGIVARSDIVRACSI